MSEAELREALSKAGSRYDGHVTNGSLNEQMRVVLEALGEVGLTVEECKRQAFALADAAMTEMVKQPGPFLPPPEEQKRYALHCDLNKLAEPYVKLKCDILATAQPIYTGRWGANELPEVRYTPEVQAQLDAIDRLWCDARINLIKNPT